MALTEALALSLGPAVAKAILKIWLKDSNVLQDIASDIVDLVKTRTSDAFTQQRAKRQFEEIGEKVAASLLPVFETDGVEIDDSGKSAIAFGVAATLNKTKITAEFLVERNLEPKRLADELLKASSSARTGLSEKETALFERILVESSRLIVDVASQLPAFTERSFSEVLKRENLLVSTTNQILEEVRRIREGSALDNSVAEAVQFETEYRLAVGRKLDELELFGVDFESSVNRRHRLSVAYVTLSVSRAGSSTGQRSEDVNQPSTDEEDDDANLVTVDVALAESQRLLVRGQAGSGKTTLLQWIAVRAASRSFPENLKDWNARIPFFIRLRDCVEKGLPAPEKFPQLIAPSISDTMPAGWVHDKLREGQAIILIDGVDEMLESQREDVRKWVKDLGATFPKARILVSSRPSAINEGWMDAEGFQDAELQPMDIGDVENFVEHWHKAVQEQLHEPEEIRELGAMSSSIKTVIRSNAPIRNLATSPLLCAMLCALNRDRRQNLPGDRIELYEACCQMLAERRDKERRVALKDYPQLSYRQKMSLLEDLSYWFLLNGWSVVPKVRATERVAARLPNMLGLDRNAQAPQIIRLFVERTGIVREPQPDHIDFTHRTFQEFLAAKAALAEGNVGALVKEAHEDQWREVIVLAAGLASPKVRDELVNGLISRGDLEAKHKHQLHLLAVSCLETSVELDPQTKLLVSERLQRLVPPKNLSEAADLSAAGEMAVPYLRKNRYGRATEAAASIRCLSMIGGEGALDALATYGGDWRQTVHQALIRAWQYFDREEFATRVLGASQRLSFNSLRTLDGFQFLPKLEILRVWWLEAENLEPLAQVKTLKELRISGAPYVESLAPLANHPSLESIHFGGSRLKDVAALASMPKLKEVNLPAIGPDVHVPELRPEVSVYKHRYA